MRDDQNVLASFGPLFNWLNRHFNIHRFLWLLAAVLFLAAWNRGLALLYGMFALIIGVLGLSYVYPFVFLRKIAVKRKQKTVVKAGEKLTLEYQVISARQLFYIEISDDLPFNFTMPDMHCFLPVVPESYQFNVSVDCELRGLFEMGEVTLASSYPFGIYRRSGKVETENSSVLVLPKTFAVGNLLYALYSRLGVEGHIQSVIAGFNHEFSGLREYRYGDSLKRVHWASTARHQELIIKEYEHYDRPTILIVLDQHQQFDVGELPETTFEFAVQIAASVIESAIENNIGVYVYGRGRDVTRFSVMPGALGSREFLERLALVKADGNIPYIQVINEAMTEFDKINTVMTFTLRASKDADQLTGMIDGHITHLDIEMVGQSFIYPLNHYSLNKAFRRGGRISWSVTRASKLEALFAS